MIDFTFGSKFFPKRALLASIWFANFSLRCLKRQFLSLQKSNMSNSGPANFLESPKKNTSSIRILYWHISGIRLATRSVGWSGKYRPYGWWLAYWASGVHPHDPGFHWKFGLVFWRVWLSKIEVNLGFQKAASPRHIRAASRQHSVGRYHNKSWQMGKNANKPTGKKQVKGKSP